MLFTSFTPLADRVSQAISQSILDIPLHPNVTIILRLKLAHDSFRSNNSGRYQNIPVKVMVDSCKFLVTKLKFDIEITLLRTIFYVGEVDFKINIFYALLKQMWKLCK